MGKNFRVGADPVEDATRFLRKAVSRRFWFLGFLSAALAARGLLFRSARVAVKLTALAALTVAGMLATATAATAGAGWTTTYGSANPSIGARTIPYFADSFDFGGTAYPYTMVGTNPRTSTATTTVPTVVVPLRLVFADGHVSEVGTSVKSVLASPIFQNARFTSGRTQYGDAIQRAMFWKYDATTTYHVLLGRPLVLATQTLNVPQGQGVYLNAGDLIGPPSLGFHTAAPTGVVSISWFYAAFDQLLNSLKVDPATLPIVLGRNVVLTTKPVPYGQPVFGFHSAASSTAGNGSQQVQTAIWSSFGDPYPVAEVPSLGRNIFFLSHEVSEWLADPFTTNTVPAWQSPLPFASGFYGCQSLLETGDPLVDVGFGVNGYQLQDEAFLSWFAHQVPSIGINGQYSYLGTFTEPSPLC
jgi:hypothetical protein